MFTITVPKAYMDTTAFLKAKIKKSIIKKVIKEVVRNATLLLKVLHNKPARALAKRLQML